MVKLSSKVFRSFHITSSNSKNFSGRDTFRSIFQPNRKNQNKQFSRQIVWWKIFFDIKVCQIKCGSFVLVFSSVCVTMSGLAALTANYTDSEDEDLSREDQEIDSGPPSNLATKSGTATPSSAKSTPNSSSKVKNLVSYGDIQDENDDKDAEPVPMELESDEESKDGVVERTEDQAAAKELLNRSGSTVEVDAWSDGTQLPPEPAGLCSPRIQEAVNRAMQKKQERGYDMNKVIQQKKAFRNPSIYEKLIQFCEIDEHGTNFPKNLYDGHLFGPESYYDELAKVQKSDMERREKAAKAKAAAIAAANASSNQQKDTSAEAPKRKSKWDQGPGPAVVRTAQPGKSSIPAFGSLKK